MSEPSYLAIARRDIGLTEVKGVSSNAKITNWLSKLQAWWRDDETPWCGVALAAWVSEAGYSYPKAYYRALAWKDYGDSLDYRKLPPVGAIAVLGRKGGGHVGIVTGVTESGSHVRLLGGNQGDKVCEAWFDVGRVVAYRKPMFLVLRKVVTAKLGELSKSEA